MGNTSAPVSKTLADGSYDAAEDNEISFKEGDRITSIEKVDEDWWQGTINGQTGLFPGERMPANTADMQRPTCVHQISTSPLSLIRLYLGKYVHGCMNTWLERWS